MRLSQTKPILIIGGGLSGCLLALRLSQVSPHITVHLIDDREHLGQGRTWSAHASVVGRHPWLKSLRPVEWPRHEIKFPNLVRTIHSPYFTFEQQTVERVLKLLPNLEIHNLSEVISCSTDSVTFKDSSKGSEPNHLVGIVVDTTGKFCSSQSHYKKGYQKFLGLEFEFSSDHGVIEPILMDSTVAQTDGFRFYYVLPLSSKRLLIEETHYSDLDSIDEILYKNEIKKYSAENLGLSFDQLRPQVVREEKGALPIPLSLEFRRKHVVDSDRPIGIGFARGYFHPVTGYSLPVAVEMVDRVALGLAQGANSDKIKTSVEAVSNEWSKVDPFFIRVNRLLFLAAVPEQRYKMLEHFYRLNLELINRFYSGKITGTDQIRFFIGKPPVPIQRAMREFLGNSLNEENA